jgi:hypothetical protein
VCRVVGTLEDGKEEDGLRDYNEGIGMAPATHKTHARGGHQHTHTSRHIHQLGRGARS